jgi:hypothetical protein
MKSRIRRHALLRRKRHALLRATRAGVVGVRRVRWLVLGVGRLGRRDAGIVLMHRRPAVIPRGAAGTVRHVRVGRRWAVRARTRVLHDRRGSWASVVRISDACRRLGDLRLLVLRRGWRRGCTIMRRSRWRRWSSSELLRGRATAPVVLVGSHLLLLSRARLPLNGGSLTSTKVLALRGIWVRRLRRRVDLRDTATPSVGTVHGTRAKHWLRGLGWRRRSRSGPLGTRRSD